MALEQLEGIANVSYGQVQTLTWETASDWDNAAAEKGVVHENVANTDHGDASTIKKGYSAASPYKSASLEQAYLCHEDSGSTMYDFSGNNADGSYSGPTLGQTGLLGTTAPSYDGVDDYARTANSGISGAATWAFWVIEDSDVSDTTNPHISRNDNRSEFLIRDGSNSSAWARLSGTDYKGGSVSTGTWHFYAATSDGSNGELFLDASSVNSYSDSWESLSNFNLMTNDSQNEEWVAGRLAGAWLWNVRLTATEIQEFYDTVRGTSYLETATKSFSSNVQPDLSNLSYSLNGQSIDLKVIGSPGTADEEVVTQTLDGSTSYALTWSSSHTDFRLRPELSTTDETTTPTFSSGTLTT